MTAEQITKAKAKAKARRAQLLRLMHDNAGKIGDVVAAISLNLPDKEVASRIVARVGYFVPYGSKTVFTLSLKGMEAILKQSGIEIPPVEAVYAEGEPK